MRKTRYGSGFQDISCGEEQEMRKGLLTLVLMLVLSAAMVSSAYAKNEFESGFKYELGAIAARSAVGLGVGVVQGVLGGGVYYDGYYARPAPIYYDHPRPYYRERVVYRPYPPPRYRVEHRVYHHGPRYVPPPRVHRHYEYHYHYYR
jgi:hypothetical protein